MASSFIYVVWQPGDDDSCLNWFTVYPTLAEAREHGQEIARSNGWRYKYISRKSGGSETDYWGKRTIVVSQQTHLHFGA